MPPNVRENNINELIVNTFKVLKAELEEETGNIKEAIKTLDQALLEADLPEDHKLRTHGIYKRLSEYREKLSGKLK